MKQLFILLAVIAATQAQLFGSWRGGLRVKFNVGILPGRNFFFQVPLNIEAAVLDGHNLVARPEGPLPQLVLYCPGDRIACAFYDDTGYVAGLSINLPDGEYTGSVLDWPTQGFVRWNATTSDGVAKNFWSIQQYFVDEEFLARSAEDRIRTRNPDKMLQAGAIWVHGINREIVRISANGDEMIASGLFTEQACIPWMGRHYYYNMTADTPCTSAGLFPWFPIEHSHEVIAMGLVTFGSFPAPQNGRDWFERPTKSNVELIVPRGPQCLYNLAEHVGLVTMHIYYVDTPWLINCIFQ